MGIDADICIYPIVFGRPWVLGIHMSMGPIIKRRAEPGSRLLKCVLDQTISRQQHEK